MIFLGFVIGLKYLDSSRMVLACSPQPIDMGLMIFLAFKTKGGISRCTAMS